MAEKSTRVIDPFDWAREFLSADELVELRKFLKNPLDLSIRINTLKWDTQEAARKLKERYSWKLEAVPFCPGGFWIREYKIPPSTTIEHRTGYFYVQEAASMLPPELFDLGDTQQPLILDMAASPGGKTSHIAALTGGHGLIIANDSSRSRIPALQIVLRTWGAINQCVTCLPGESFGNLYPDTFDAVLLDAPCSMQGLRSAESHTSRPVTAAEIEVLAERQTRLLESALRAAKPGGQIVYSTCTLAPQEDEGVLANIMKKFPEIIRIDSAEKKLPKPAPAITKIGNLYLPTQTGNAQRLWPHTYGTAGFFAARLTKLAPLPDKGQSAWQKQPRKTLYSSLEKKAKKTICDAIQSMYGFNLRALLDKSQLELMQKNKRIYLIPTLLSRYLIELPYLSAGMEAGRIIRDEFIPSHELVSRFGDHFSNGVLRLESHFVDAWLRGEDLRGYQNGKYQQGSLYAIRDGLGRNLGRGKLLSDRLKNMLPTRLF